MKRWHRSMKRKPVVGCDLIIIWKNKVVELGVMMMDEFGESYLSIYGADDSYGWDYAKEHIKQWAYVDKYFEKELNDKEI